MNTPRVTVLLPSYDAAKHLHEAITSILAQTFTDFELLVLDDGSRDESIAIARAFTDPRVVVHALPHRGLSQTLNDGIRLARGELIARMDSDDIAWPKRFALQVAYLDTHPTVLGVGGQVRYLRNGVYRHGPPKPCDPAELQARLIETCVMVHPAMMLRTAILRAVGGYRAAFSRAEDYDLWLRLSEIGELANVPEILLDLRHHDANVSTVHSLQQAIDALAARASALMRRRTGLDPFADLHGPFTLEDLVRLPMPAAVHREWVGLAFMELARHHKGESAPGLLDRIHSEARAALRDADADGAAMRAFRVHVICGYFALADDGLRARRPDRFVSNVGHALRVAPLLASQRIARYIQKRLRQATHPGR